MCVTAGFLQIHLLTKPTLHVTLQTKFQYSSTLNVWYIDYLIVNLIASIQNIKLRVQKCLHPQCHFQLIDSTEANQACTEHEIKQEA